MLIIKVATLICATMMADGGKMLPCLGDCTNSAGTLAYSWCETKGSTWRFYNITLTKKKFKVLFTSTTDQTQSGN